MLDHVFLDAIGALRDAFENALLERQALEERFQVDVLLGDTSWETAYSLPGEGLPPRIVGHDPEGVEGRGLAVRLEALALDHHQRAVQHRPDTLGLDDNDCPVILEYKRSLNENVINQGLFYLNWLMDHQAEFKLLVLERFGRASADSIDWSGPRL